MTKIKRFWCCIFHSKHLSWPIHRRYRCYQCHEIYTVNWSVKRRHTKPVLVRKAVDPVLWQESLERAIVLFNRRVL